MYRMLVLLVLSNTVIAEENTVFCRYAQPAAQQYVEQLAHRMGIHRRVTVLIAPDARWAAAPREGYVFVPAEAEGALGDEKHLRLHKNGSLYKGLLMHELAHISQYQEQPKTFMYWFYVRCTLVAHLQASREQEQAADAAVLDEREVLVALRDYFLSCSKTKSLQELEQKSSEALLCETCATRTHPADAARALYFHRRVQRLDERQ